VCFLFDTLRKRGENNFLFFFFLPLEMCCFFKLNLRSRTIWVTDLLERGKSEVEKKKERESIPLNVVVWTTDERVCVYICILMRATWFHPYFSFLFFPLSLFNMYGCICVPTSMINHIVLSTQWNLAIISDGGDVNHIKIKNRERKQQVIYSWFLAYLPWWMNSCWCS